MALDRSRRLCFCLQFGASVTFASSRRHIVDRVRRATSVWSQQPRELYGSYDGRVQKHYAPSMWSRDITVQRIKSFGTRSVQKAKEITSGLQEKISRKVTQQVSEKWTCYSFCTAFIAFLFLYVNLLLAGYAGGGLAAAARLWWDPTTYVVGRELDAHYFELTRYGVPAAAACLLLLTVLAALALHARRRRRRRRMLLLLYVVMMVAMAAGEAVLLYFVYNQSEPRLEVGREHLKELVANTREVLDLVAQYHDFTETFRPILEEIEKEQIVQLEILTTMITVLGVLQVLAVVLALVVAYYPPGRRK